MTTPTPDPTTVWFPVGKEVHRLSVASLSTFYGGLILVPGMFSLLGVVAQEFALTVVPLVLAGVGALVGVVHAAYTLQAIRRAHQVLGIESRGLWWHDSGSMVFMDWDTIRAVQLHNHRVRGMYSGTTLDLFPAVTMPDHTAHGPGDRHRIELTRAPTVPHMIMLTSTNLPTQIAQTIATLRPDKYIGPT